MINGNVRFPSTNIDKHAPQFFFVFRENGLANRDRLQHRIANQMSTAIHRRYDVLSRGG